MVVQFPRLFFNFFVFTQENNNGKKSFLQMIFVFFETLCFYEVISLLVVFCIFILFFFAIFFSIRLIFAKSTIWALGYFSAFLLTLFFSLFLLGLDYISLVFLIIYVGGVAVLFLFGIFLMNGYELVLRHEKKNSSQFFFFVIFLFFIFVFLFFYCVDHKGMLNFYELYSVANTSETFLVDLNTGFMLEKFAYYEMLSMRSMDFFMVAFFLYEYCGFVVLIWGFMLLWVLFILNDLVYFFPAGMRELLVGYNIYLRNISYFSLLSDKPSFDIQVKNFIIFMKIVVYLFLGFLVNLVLFVDSIMTDTVIPYTFFTFLIFVTVYVLSFEELLTKRFKYFWFFIYFILTTVFIGFLFFFVKSKSKFELWYLRVRRKRKFKKIVYLKKVWVRKLYCFYHFLACLQYNYANKIERFIQMNPNGFRFFFENLTGQLTDSSLIFAKKYISGFFEKGTIFWWTFNMLLCVVFCILYSLPTFGKIFFFADLLNIMLDVCWNFLLFYCLIFGLYILRNIVYKSYVGLQSSEIFCWRITLKIFIKVIVHNVFVSFLLILFTLLSGVFYGYFLDASFLKQEIIVFYDYYNYLFVKYYTLYVPVLVIYVPVVLLFFLLIFFGIGYFYLRLLKNDFYLNRLSIVHLEFGFARVYTTIQICILFFQGILFFCLLNLYNVYTNAKRITNAALSGVPAELRELIPLKSDFYFVLRLHEKVIYYGKNFYLFNVSWNFDLLSILLVGLTIIIFTLCFIYNISQQKIFEIDVLFFQIFLYFFLEIILIFFFFTDNLLIFYATFEFSLLPTFILIWFFGKRSRRIFAGYSFIFYTFMGSALFLVVLIFIYYRFSTFDISTLTFLCRKESISFQKFCWFATFLAFAVKIPLVPLHSWLPETHVEAPTAVSVILAAILLKLGLYGLVRITIPLFPEGTLAYSNYVLMLSVVGLLYATIICFYQIDIKKIVAYSSVAHMSGAVLALFLGTKLSILSFYIMIFSHAIISSALFFLIGCLYDRYSTRLIKDFGGLARVLPNFSFFFFFFCKCRFTGYTKFLERILFNNFFIFVIV